ncbi:MAG: sulfatase [Chloroflexi bacterium]|nr:sulfatase [Chloroflexota bacterium]
MTSVHVYVMDSLRYDYVSDELTPNLQKLARDGVHFTNAIAQATWSSPSAASVITGLYPNALGKFALVERNFKAMWIGLPVTVDTIATAFHKKGFHTAAFSANLFFSATFGMQRGFDFMPELYDLPELAERAAMSRQLSKNLPKTRDLMLPLITGADLHHQWTKHRAAHRDGPQLTFVWAMDTHEPFFDRERVEELLSGDVPFVHRIEDNVEQVKQIYRGMVGFSDRQLGKLIDELKASGDYNDSFIFVFADHGEAFGERGQTGHGGLGYEALLKVPFFIKFPANRFAGRNCDKLVGLMDILPTLAAWFDLTVKQDMHGQDLVQVLEGNSEGHPYLVIDDQTFDRKWQHGVVRYPSKKVIFRRWNGDPEDERAGQSPGDVLKRLPYHIGVTLRHGRQHLTNLRRSLQTRREFMHRQWVFDLANDPAEEHDISYSWRGRRLTWMARWQFRRYRRQVLDFFDTYVKKIRIVERNEKVAQRLRDLGYLE